MPAESPLPSVPSAPSSSRRRSVQPSSVSAASELPTDELASERTPLVKKRSEPAITFMDDLKEVEEKEEVEPRSVKKTPRRSEGSGFSDFNPFQSGSEDAADRERRRRKVRCVALPNCAVLICSLRSDCPPRSPLSLASRSLLLLTTPHPLPPLPPSQTYTARLPVRTCAELVQAERILNPPPRTFATG